MILTKFLVDREKGTRIFSITRENKAIAEHIIEIMPKLFMIEDVDVDD